MRRFTQIQNLSDRRRLPRLGKVRLGVRVKKQKQDSRCQHDASGQCNYCTYPRETAYFVVPAEVAKIYGPEPVELDIMLPVDDLGTVFPQAYEHYGSGRGLKCTGDGQVAYELDEETKEMRQRPCPCEKLESGLCGERAHLAVILPKVSVGGIYQIDTGSINSIVDLNSSIEYARALVGRIAMVPLVLKREPRETHHDGKRQIHYTMRIELKGDVNFVNQLRENTTKVLTGPSFSVPPPEQTSPVFDGEGRVVPEEEDDGLTAIETLRKKIDEAETAADAAAVMNSAPAEVQKELRDHFKERLKRFNSPTQAGNPPSNQPTAGPTEPPGIPIFVKVPQGNVSSQPISHYTGPAADLGLGVQFDIEGVRHAVIAIELNAEEKIHRIVVVRAAKGRR